MNTHINTCLALVLAAGKSSRMKSATSKVLHDLGGRPVIMHVLETLKEIGCTDIGVVIGKNSEDIVKTVAPHKTILQESPLGTGHAVMVAKSFIENNPGDVFILFGDTPLITAETLHKMWDCKDKNSLSIVVLGMRVLEDHTYGRIFLDSQGQVLRIVEHLDAASEEQQNTLCNSGVMLVDRILLLTLLDQLTNHNSKGEYYLTDLIALAQANGYKTGVVEASAQELLGVNNRLDLAEAEKAFQQRWRQGALDQGVTLKDPQTVYFSFDTHLAPDVIVEENVHFGPGVSIGTGVRIKAFSYLEGVSIKEHAVVGPFARLRPGTVIEKNVHIGNFVEIKKSTIHQGAKVNHLSYVGDAIVGAKANIGAGTITCNYDGFNKYQTIIGSGAFIGSNSALVAPVIIGDGAIVGAGSVITKDVSPDDLSIARGFQKNISHGAKNFRNRKIKE